MFPASPAEPSVVLEGSHGTGWSDDPHLVEEPTIAVRAVGLHYGQIAFEGMRASVGAAGLAAFRPDLHHERLCRSMERLGMPVVEWSVFGQVVGTLLRAVGPPPSSAPDEFLYLRPIVLATDPDWSTGGAEHFRLHLLAGWTRPAYHRVPRIVAKVEADRRRAWPGGTGDVKVPSNYAATVVAERQARGDGAHLVLWLDPADRRVEEFSSSSALLVDGEGRLIAPPPSSTVLDGVTRRSVVELATEAGTEVRQDPFVWPDPSAADAGPDGTMLAAGTAAGLVVVDEVVEGRRDRRTTWRSSASPIADELRRRLRSAHRGEVRPGWTMGEDELLGAR